MGLAGLWVAGCGLAHASWPGSATAQQAQRCTPKDTFCPNGRGTKCIFATHSLHCCHHVNGIRGGWPTSLPSLRCWIAGLPLQTVRGTFVQYHGLPLIPSPPPAEEFNELEQAYRLLLDKGARGALDDLIK